MPRARITVLKKMCNQDLVCEYKYVSINAREESEPPCGFFEEGQEFLLEDPDMPKGFCSWAWADIQRDVFYVMYGSDIPGMRQRGTAIVCCTDGLRPVVFKIERLD